MTNGIHVVFANFFKLSVTNVKWRRILPKFVGVLGIKLHIWSHSQNLEDTAMTSTTTNFEDPTSPDFMSMITNTRSTRYLRHQLMLASGFTVDFIDFLHPNWQIPESQLRQGSPNSTEDLWCIRTPISHARWSQSQSNFRQQTMPTNFILLITEAGPRGLGLDGPCGLQMQLSFGVSLPASSLPPRITDLFHSGMLPRWNAY